LFLHKVLIVINVDVQSNTVISTGMSFQPNGFTGGMTTQTQPIQGSSSMTNMSSSVPVNNNTNNVNNNITYPTFNNNEQQQQNQNPKYFGFFGPELKKNN
jgi:hypothetical protein